MSVAAFLWAWNVDVGLTPAQQLMLLSLADYADERGVCDPSMMKLCKRSRMSERNARLVIRQLGEKRLIDIVPRNDPTTGAAISNSYRLLRDHPGAKNAAPPANGNGKHHEPVPEEIRKWLCETANLKPLAASDRGEFWKAMEKAYDQYPWLYFEEEIKKADVWMIANPKRKPTPAGLSRFMRTWFENAVERGRRRQNGQTARR